MLIRLFRLHAAAAMRSHKVNDRVYWDDPVRVNRFMAVMIMSHDMLKIRYLCNAWRLIELTRIRPDIWVIYDPFTVTFEVQMINHIETQ